MIFFHAEVLLCALWLGWLLDLWLGEPGRFHPLIGLGRVVTYVEKRMNKPCRHPSEQAAFLKKRLAGMVAMLLICLPLTFSLAGLALWSSADMGFSEIGYGVFWCLLNGILLWIAVGARSLQQHLLWIFQPLQAGNLDEAREKTGWIVSRDTHDMDEMRVCRAGIESGLENGNDAIYAPIFWFLIAGAPGVCLYRIVNTLDAMWGYRTERFLYFGWASARLDDGMNYIPARITAFIYLICGHTVSGWRCWRSQAKHWDSPNAGPVMAAGAGALKLTLGGGDTYHGVWKERPLLGPVPEAGGKLPVAEDLMRAIRLVQATSWCWMLLASLVLLIAMQAGL